MTAFTNEELELGYRAKAADLQLHAANSGDRRFQSQVAEVVNRNLLVTELLMIGFNAYLPVYDRGVDLIAFRDVDGLTRPIQLKGRWMIDRKYRGLGIWIAFHEAGEWFTAPHDEMIKMGEDAGYCASSSWVNGGAYSCPRLSTSLRARMSPHRLRHSNLFAPTI